MVISRTPLRVSFAGGGTDFPDYYSKDFGSVISTAIDKFIYVTVENKFDKKIHVRYSQIEEVEKVSDIRNDLVREALKVVGISQGVEIVTISDVPMKGSGLGSSSALTVGLLNALFEFKGCSMHPYDLARMACKIEIDILGAPIGKQDQYACALGGLNCFTFAKDGSVSVKNLIRHGDFERIKWLEENSMLFYLGYTRSANEILVEHKENIESKRLCLDRLRDLVLDLSYWLSGEGGVSPDSILNISWKLKKSISAKYSSDSIDSLINKLSMMDNVGVKLCGAGGGGFMLVVCDEKDKEAVRYELKDLRELPFQFINEGSKVIYNDKV